MATAGEDCPTNNDGSLNPQGCASGNCEEVTDPDGTTRQACTQISGGGRGGRKKKKRRSGKKRGMNNFFKLMLAAKKKKEPSFVYNGTTYHGHPHPMLGMVYKKSKAPLKNLGKTKKRRRGKSKKMGMKKRGKSKRRTRRKGKKSRRRRR